MVRRRILALAVTGALAAGGGAALAAANGSDSSPAKKPAKTHPAAKDPAHTHHCPLRDQTSGSNL